MELTLWRHAEAEDESDEGADLQRALTGRGEKQAARVAAWLDRHLPESTRIFCSPAVRCEQTVAMLRRKYKVRDELVQGASVDDLLAVAEWPDAKQPVLIVGHQPVIGETIARLMNMQGGSCAVRKGAAWWLRTRERDGQQQTVLVTVQSPDHI
jgi:phosphohistidine phosphatase